VLSADVGKEGGMWVLSDPLGTSMGTSSFRETNSLWALAAAFSLFFLDLLTFTHIQTQHPMQRQTLNKAYGHNMQISSTNIVSAAESPT